MFGKKAKIIEDLMRAKQSTGLVIRTALQLNDDLIDDNKKLKREVSELKALLKLKQVEG